MLKCACIASNNYRLLSWCIEIYCCAGSRAFFIYAVDISRLHKYMSSLGDQMGGKNRRTESGINGPGISIFWKIFKTFIGVLVHPHSACNHHFIAYSFYRK